MSEKGHNQNISHAYPQYISAPYADDDISLVDLWISLQPYRKVFLATFLIVLIIGLLYTFVIFTQQQKFSLVTTLQIGSVVLQDSMMPLEKPASLVSKINEYIVPHYIRKWRDDNQGQHMTRPDVSNPRDSQIILISHKVRQDEIDLYSEFQTGLVRLVLEDQQRVVDGFRAGMVSALEGARSRLDDIQNPMTLEKLEQLEALMKASEKNLQQQIVGLQRVNDALFARAEGASSKSAGEITNDPLSNQSIEHLLMDNRLKADQQLLEIEKIKLALASIKLGYQESINDQLRHIKELVVKLDSYNETRVISDPVSSSEPAGPGRNTLILLLVFVAGFAGLLVMLLVMFNDKLKRRKQELFEQDA